MKQAAKPPAPSGSLAGGHFPGNVSVCAQCLGAGTDGDSLGQAVGIKLFADGVLVVGLSELDEDAGKSLPSSAA